MAKSILFVDADSIQVEELKPVLEKRGFIVDWAVDGEQGLEKFKRDKYSAAIIELFLPKISGHELIKKFREESAKKKIPIILTSSLLKGLDLDDDTVRERWGADRFLDKPIDANLLLWSLEELIEQYGVEEEAKEEKIEEKKPEAIVEEKPRPSELPFVVQGIEQRGSLKVLGVLELAGWLWHQKKTATLKLINNRQEVLIYFKDGKPIRIEESLSDVNMAEELFRRGAIPLEDCLLNLKTFELFRFGPQGRIIRTGKLKLSDLVWAINDIQKERALAVLEWNAGAFQIVDEIPERVEQNITISPYQFIKLAVERSDSGRLAEIYGDIYALKVKRVEGQSKLLDQLELSAEEKNLWNNLEVEQTVENFVNTSGLSPLAAFKVLYLFLILGLATLEKPIELSQLRALLLKIVANESSTPSASGKQSTAKESAEPSPSQVEGAEFKLIDKPTAPSAKRNEQVVPEKEPQPKSEEPTGVAKETLMSAEVSFRMGLNFLRQGNFVDARRELEKAVEALPNDPIYNAYFAWATYQSKLPDYPTAVQIAEKHFKKAVDLKSESDTVLLLWGKYLRAKGELSKAVVVFTRAVKINPKNPEAQAELKKALAAIAQKKLKEEEANNKPEEPSLSKLLTKRIIK